MFKKALKDASIVFLSVCVVSCSLKTFGDKDPGITNKKVGEDLYNLEPAVTPSFVDSAFCTGDFGDLEPIEIYANGSAQSLCQLAPTKDLRGIEFAALNVTSRSAVGRIAINPDSGSPSSYKGITFDAARAALSPYIDYEAEEEVQGADLRSLYHTIVADERPVLRTPSSCNKGDGEVDGACVDRAEREHTDKLEVFNSWEELAVEDRLEYMGISLSDWNQVSYHLTHHVNAYDTHRAEKRAKRRRYLGIFVAVVLTIATAGSGATLGTAFASSLSGIASGTGALAAMATVAVKASAAIGGMVVAAGISAFTTLVVTGDFKLAMKALGAMFESELKAAIRNYVGQLAGISPETMKLATEAYKNGNDKELLEGIALKIVGEFTHDFLEELVDDENELNGFQTFLKGFANKINETDDPQRFKDYAAEYAAGFMGGYVSSFLHIKGPKGKALVERMLNTGLSEQNFDAKALRSLFVDQVKTRADGLPEFIKQKLGGTDNAEGIFSDVVAESLLEAPEDIDKAKEKLEKFIDDLKEKYNWDPDLGDVVSQEVSKLYDHIKSNGIGDSSVEVYLSQHHMVEHLVTTYTSANVAQNGLLTAMDYADRHHLDKEVIEHAMMEDVIDTVKEAAIPDEIKNIFGGNGKVIAEFQTSFAIRLAYHRNRDRGLSEEELIEKSLVDLEMYGEKFADGYVGTYDSAMISASLDGNVDPFLKDMARLYGNGNYSLAVQFFKDSLRVPLEEVHIDLKTFDNEEIMDVIQSGINVLLSKGTPPQMLDAMGNAMSYYSQRDVCRTCN